MFQIGVPMSSQILWRSVKNSREMASVFRHHRCVLNQSSNIPTKFGQTVKKWQPFFGIKDGGYRHLEFFQLCISNVIDMFQIEVPMFPIMFVTMGRILKKCQQCFSKSKMAAAIILKSALPVERPSWEMNSLFVICNQKCNYIGYLDV